MNTKIRNPTLFVKFMPVMAAWIHTLTDQKLRDTWHQLFPTTPGGYNYESKGMSPSKNSLEQIKEKELAIYYKSMYLLRLMGINPSKDSFKKFPVNQFALYLTNNALYGKIRGKGSIKISFNEEILVRITNAITNNSRITEEDRSEILKFSVSSRYIDSKECKLYCKVKDKLEKEIMIHEKDLNKGINQEIFNSIINFINSNAILNF